MFAEIIFKFKKARLNMRKKKLVPLIVLCSALACVIALYAVLSAYNSQNDADDANGDKVAEPLVTVNETDITALTYKNEESDISLEKKDGKWIIADDEAYPVDSAKVSKMLSAVCALSYERALDGTDAESYGLDEPKLTVTFCVGESSYTFKLGATNSYNSLSYLGFDDGVYMISDTLSSAFDISKEDLFAVNDAFPSEITADSVSSIEILSNGETKTISDSEGLEELLHLLQKYCSFATPDGYGLNDDGLTDYGITDESSRISVNYSTDSAKAIFELVFGEYGDGDVCYTLPDSDTTYSIDADGYSEIMNYIYYSPSEDVSTSETTDE